MRLCLATNNPADYDVLVNSPHLISKGIDHGKTIHSVCTLLRVIANDRTDLLIVDAALPGVDLFDSLSTIKAQKNIQIILIAPTASFHYAYQAMKIQACELLVRPFTIQQLSAALSCAVDHFKADYAFNPKRRENSRCSFAEQLSVIIDGRKSSRIINEIYNTTFQNGLYRVVTLAIDSINIENIPQLSEQIWHSIRRLLEEKLLIPYTYDILHALIYNEIRIILNYQEDYEEMISSFLPFLFLHAEKVCSNSTGVEIYMGIGNAYSDINKLPLSSEESRNGIWKRLAKYKGNKNKIFKYSEEILVPDKYYQKITDLEKQIKTSIENLNTQAFQTYVNDFFSLPEDILCLPEAKNAIMRQVKYFCTLYKSRLDSWDSADTFYYQTKMVLLSARSFTEYKNKYIRSFIPMFERLLSAVGSCSNKSVEQTKTYIVNNYMKEISLETAARQVQLSPPYLSRLFKEETGQTFSDFLLEQRLQNAKVLLIKTNYKINEISSAVGYYDQRYFSRLFTRHIGLTPSMFRKAQQAD